MHNYTRKKGSTFSLLAYATSLFYVAVLGLSRIPEVHTDTALNSEIIRLATFNTEYWHDPESELLEAADYVNQDFILFQEHLEKTETSYIATDRISELSSAAPGYYIGHYGEVVTLSRFEIIDSKHFGDGTALRTDHLLPNGRLLSIYNIHFPVHIHLDLLANLGDFLSDLTGLVGERSALLKELKNDVSSNENMIVLAGDFNTSVAMNTNNWFAKNMSDAFAAPHCQRSYGTWGTSSLMSWRIDYIYSANGALPAHYCVVDSRGISDHKMILAKISIED